VCDVTGWTPIPESERTVLAESESPEWPWALEAWRQPDREGVEQVHYTVRDRRDSGLRFEFFEAESDRPTRCKFTQRRDGDESVLFGPIGDGVEKVVVEPLLPMQEAPEEAAIVGSGLEVGPFFVHFFDHRVQRAKVTGEPSEAWTHQFPYASNIILQARRQVIEGTVIGEGRTPAGKFWRLRVWIDDEGMAIVTVVIVDAAADLDRHEQAGFPGSGYGVSPRKDGVLAKFSSHGGTPNEEQRVMGELDPSVSAIRLRLDDGAEIDANILRTDLTEDDYFLAFIPEHRDVAAVIALDEDDQVLREEARSEEELAQWRKLRERLKDGPPPTSQT
jgi:hypothetical protein